MNGDRVPDGLVEDVDEALAAVAHLVARAGLAADARQLGALASLYRRLRPALDALRAGLGPEAEPTSGVAPRWRSGRVDRGGG
jgi:hypothetical protein